MKKNADTVTDAELKTISARLYSLDVEGLYDQPDLDIQNDVTTLATKDFAPRKLFNNCNIPPNWRSKPTFNKLLETMSSSRSGSTLTSQMAFLEAIVKTQVVQEAHKFLLTKEFYVGKTRRIDSFKDYLKTIWFDLYKRGSFFSSGFRHVFLGDWQDGKVSGLHYWMKYQLEESKGKINYLGYKNSTKIGKTRTCLIDLPLQWEGVTKNFTTMTTCSSPALDIALYTVCFLARPNATCPVQAGPSFHASHNIKNPLRTSYFIQTFQIIRDHRTYVGTAYPKITLPKA